MSELAEQMLPINPPILIYIRTHQGEYLLAGAAGSKSELVQEEGEWAGPGARFRLKLEWLGPEVIEAGLIVRYPLHASVEWRILIPSIFYGDNGVGSPSTHYPRLGPLNKEAFTAFSWDFASERTALPAVFAQNEQEFSWLAVEPNNTGVGFTLQSDKAELRLHYPGLELPFRYDRRNEAPFEPFLKLAPRQPLELTFWVGRETSPVPGAFAPVQRALQLDWNGTEEPLPLDPTLVKEAAHAAKDGLLHWHYRPLEVPNSTSSNLEKPFGMLAETVSFDGAQVREEMHVSWVSGTPTAYALLKHGLNNGDEASAAAARSVLNKVSSGLSPCGAFWGLWSEARGWRAGWNGHPEKLHARTLSEATLFLLRALVLEREHPSWSNAARSSLDFCLGCLDESGNPGSYYNALSGEVWDRRGTAGLLWVAALAEGASLFGNHGYAAAAIKVGEFYAPAVRKGELLGAPEDIGLCPSSEDGYNALIAMLSLYEKTQEKRWLELAKVAADWMLTFRWSYNVQFPEGSPLSKRGFRTLGADSASPSNIHLHNYGLICQPELFKLSKLLNDPWYANRATDHLACFPGEIALRDGQFAGAQRRGMMNEQWYTANWSLEGRAGEVGPISHAWCLGLLLYACDDWQERSATP